MDFCEDTTESLSHWKCAVFITFIGSYFFLIVFGIWLYAYHRWQSNLEKRLLLEDYQFHQNNKSNRVSGMSEGSNIIRTTSKNYDESPLLNGTEGVVTDANPE